MSAARFLWIFIVCMMFSGCSHSRRLINMMESNPGIVYDIRYATINNFAGEKLYDESKCYLHPKTAKKLNRVQKELASKGLGLKVFDCYRPISVQEKLWNLVKDEKYVAPPEEGPSHCRGAAVDVTLLDQKGVELDMGTHFDDFSLRSYPDNYDIPYESLSNRIVLRRLMEKHGFIQSTTEWWHFFDEDWKSFPVLDIRFKDLK